jgi:hypothetical protein
MEEFALRSLASPLLIAFMLPQALFAAGLARALAAAVTLPT